MESTPTAMNTSLTARQQGIVAIAAYTASGRLEELKTALNEGLEKGLTVNEIKEILVQLYAYAGFPRSLNGINTFMSVMDARRAAGIEDAMGPEAGPLPENWDRDDYGARVRAHLVGLDRIPEPSGYQLFAPAIDAFLKQHLFADIFVRDNLDYRSRELATISILAAIPGAAPQLRSHMNMAMNTGLSESALRDFVTLVGQRLGAGEGAAAAAVLETVLAERGKK